MLCCAVNEVDVIEATGRILETGEKELSKGAFLRLVECLWPSSSVASSSEREREEGVADCKMPIERIEEGESLASCASRLFEEVANEGV